jgi:hypothetical protein
MSEPKKRRARKSEAGSPKSEDQNNSAPDSYRDSTSHSEIEKPQTANQKLPTEQMEVHHHPDLHHEKKPWKEYLLEGLMIFLAVFLGFIAENIREGITERDHEKQSIESLVKAVVTDTLQLHRVIDRTTLSNHSIAALLTIKDRDFSKEENKQKFYSGIFNGVFIDVYFKSNDAALQQLNTSGSLRSIRNHGTTDSIFNYTLNNKNITAQEADNYFAFKEIINRVAKIIDLTIYKDSTMVKKSIDSINNTGVPFAFTGRTLPPINADKLLLKETYNYLTLLMGANDSYVALLNNQLNYGQRLIVYLKKEYDLK